VLFEPTYEELKAIIKLITAIKVIWFEPTYEELKVVHKYQELYEAYSLSLPMRN